MHLDLCCWGNKRPFGGRACPAFFFFYFVLLFVSCYCCYFETDSHYVAPAILELTVSTMLASNSWRCPCLCLPEGRNLKQCATPSGMGKEV